MALTDLFHTWYLTRAAGLVAFLLLWLSVVLGLLQAGRGLKGITSAVANVEVHGYVSVAAVYATVFHMVVLLFDRSVPFELEDLLLPFASRYEPGLVGLGGLAVYLSLLTIVSTYYRAKLKPNHWRLIHRLSLVAFSSAWIHGQLMGTDSQMAAIGFLYRFTGLSVLVLLGWRVCQEVGRHAHPAGRG